MMREKDILRSLKYQELVCDGPVSSVSIDRSGSEGEQPELLPCPFCGEKPVFVKVGEGFDLECQNVKCYVQPEMADLSIDKETVARQWNQRAKASNAETSSR